ncbi:Exodeoxyribonuclease VII large subunit [Meinhardsimonia xiamenensis]|jgi:exodeoxyribonuclease VII large subunit|uniref:Exodeoxyribonuclease 7 large subunit n=1 Tax=Meinhardsimonia xiamenensis TaxID=990712 RepID=A0A1G9FYG5_9RHOB|nr:exodeoxyribonuclease VII large subunit [Meinhardsimonia xiamenensis]PRX32753.1 exodeoxyribonuclease VII large subunit [Meinhardsimonia xiamenensis]SDK93444.1 Exodeoxyribonuclease VII large subunit [Meinhardsimonia xiamenensis]
MTDLIDNPQPGENAHEFTVSEISGAIRRVIEDEFGRVRVRGEVGRVFLARSGHLYFDLKDERSVLAAVSWKGQVGRLTVRPEEGMEVVATGRLTTFASQSKYQLNVEDVRPAGVGALMAMLEKRKAKLAAEGLFAPERKKRLPFLPEVIGVVTSPAGAVIRDILHRLRDRFPRHVIIWPVAVQGEACAPEVARAIEGFNRLAPGGPIPRPDVIIVARGGGSIEDLWGFNDESVVRAVAASDIPVISAVGHETDTTLIDYAADLRAPTPTAAAEMAVPVRLELLARLTDMEARLTRAIGLALDRRRQRLADLSRALPRPESLTLAHAQRLDMLSERLPRALRAVVQVKRLQLTRTAAPLRPGALKALSAERRRLLEDRAERLELAMRRNLQRRSERLQRLAAGLRPAPLRRELQEGRRALARLSERLAAAGRTRLSAARERLAGLERLRQNLGYTETLRRGFAVVRAGGHVVTRRARAAEAETLEIEFSDGRLDARPVRREASSARRPRSDSSEGGQGTLF